MKLGNKIAELRDKQDVTLIELAFHSKVDVNTIRNIEACSVDNPRLKTIVAMLSYLKAVEVLLSYNWETGEVA